MGASVGFALACAVGASAVGISAISLPFVLPAFRRVCLPYVPASETQIKNVLGLLQKCPAPATPLIDLGSGDGRIVSVFILEKGRRRVNVFYCCYEIRRAIG